MATAPSHESSLLTARFDRVYELYRNCILNELYYGYRLQLYSRIGFWLDVVIVVGSGASGVSGWIIWTSYQELAALWAVIAAASTLLAALKPILKTDAGIKRYSALFSAYRQLALSMKNVVDEIRETGEIRRDADREIERVRSRYRSLSMNDDPRPSKKLVEGMQQEVNRRVPPSSLFYPSPARAAAAAAIDPVEPWPRQQEG